MRSSQVFAFMQLAMELYIDSSTLSIQDFLELAKKLHTVWPWFRMQ